ncbi:MAG: DUF11 domain-containing protein [Flavobacteriaceae bacterium]|nr:DUF11 domain-containing protein [Flavobacteriaceae bacterium]
MNNIEVSKTGQVFEWSVTIKNKGPLLSENTMVQNNMSAGVVLLSASCDKGSYDMSNNKWTIGDMADEEVQTLLMVMKVLDIDLAPYTNEIVVSSSTLDPDQLDNIATTTVYRSSDSMIDYVYIQSSSSISVDGTGELSTPYVLKLIGSGASIVDGLNTTVTGTGIITDPFIINVASSATEIQGVYDNDADAGSNGVSLGAVYELSDQNTYGLVEGIVKIRKN